MATGTFYSCGPPAPSESRTEIPLDQFPGAAPRISFLDGGRLLIGEPSGGGVVTVDADGTDVESFPGAVAIDIHTGTVAESTPAGGINLSDLDSGALLASAVDAGDVAVDLQFGRVAAASMNEIVTLDAESGTDARAGISLGAFVTAIAAGPTANVAAVTASPGEITPWAWSRDALQPGEAVALPAGVGKPRQLAVARNGERVLVVGEDGSALVNVGTGRGGFHPRGRNGALSWSTRRGVMPPSAGTA